MDELNVKATVPFSYDGSYLWPDDDQSTTANEVLVRLALRTYPQMNAMGVFVLDEALFLNKLHLSQEDFDQAFSALEKSKIVFKYDHETNEIFIKDYFIASHSSISKQIRAQIMLELNEVQSEEIIASFYKNLRDDDKEMRGKDALLKDMKKIVKANALN